MFSRRHPYLFFLLMLSTVSAGTMLMITLLVMGTSFMVDSSLSAKLNEPAGNVGIVEITGMITSSKEVIQEIKRFRESDAIKAIVVRIDSPGGAVAPSQEIYREIIKTKASKIIIASLGTVAASGGYYAACATHKIMANPGTLTGSIGVIMEFANIQEIMKKIGLSPVVIKSAEFKDIGSPLRDLNKKEEEILQSLVDEIHLQFVKDVASARSMDEIVISKLADGRVYTGENALQMKLVDRLGNLEDAVFWAGELAGITGKIKAVYPKEDKISFVRELLESVLKELNITSAISNNFRYVIN